MNDETTIETVTHDGDKPDVKALIEELSDAIRGGEVWMQRAQLAEDTRWCMWSGQHDDGRKHADEGEDPPFPWDGASDSRVRLTESSVREATMVCNAAFKRGRWKAKPRKATEPGMGHKVSLLLQWLVFTEMRPHSERERRLAADWRNMYGVSLTMVEWERGTALELREIDLNKGIATVMGVDEEQVAAFMAALEAGEAEAPPELLDVVDLFQNAEREPELIEAMQAFLPNTKRRHLKRAAKQMRETGRMELPIPVVVSDRPKWTALKPFYNVFFNPSITTIDEAERVFVRQWLTKTELLEKQASEQWDKKFVEEVLKHPASSSTTRLEALREGGKRWEGARGSFEGGVEDRRDRYEIFCCYHKHNDDMGVPGIYKTIISAHALDSRHELFGKHELLKYARLRMPFTEHVFWRESDTLLHNVGIPYLIYTYQNEVKTQRDYRIDAASIGILPPVRRHIRDMDTPLVLGPDMPVYESVRGSTDWMQPPPSNSRLSVEIEEAVRRDANRLVGQFDAAIPAPVIAMHQQELADAYLDEMVDILSQTLMLAGQYMPEVMVTRVAGLRKPFAMNNDELRSEFDLEIVFDARELDSAYIANKLKALHEVVNMDVTGVIDRARLISLSVEVIDAHWAEELVTSADEAALKEVSEEQMNIALIMTGQEPAMVEEGQNFGIRLQVLENTLGQSPLVQQAYQGNEIIQELLDNRRKHLHHMVEQKSTNAQIGRVGAGKVY